jgi:hypothetical protein
MRIGARFTPTLSSGQRFVLAVALANEKTRPLPGSGWYDAIMQRISHECNSRMAASPPFYQGVGLGTPPAGSGSWQL